MSLKDQTNTEEIFTRYGLTEEEFKTYLVFLSQPQVTVSEVADMLEKDVESVTKIAAKLEENNFIKKIPGVIERYIPLEPYFSLFNKDSEVFREEIGTIKDNVLQDQSKRFEKLEGIEKNAVDLIDTAVSTQVNDFFRDSDTHDADKKATIENARDRFTTTSQGVEQFVQETLFAGRDRYETTSKTLESDLHTHIDDNYNKFKQYVDTRDSEADSVWDTHDQKFTDDNQALDNEVDQIANDHIANTQTLESNVHEIIDNLNGQLKSIADDFKSKYDQGIGSQKDNLNQIVDGLLDDISNRVAKLEEEIKTDLDAHVDHHKENAEGCKPRLEEILAKYISRFKAVIEELKATVSKLLMEHEDHVNDTTTKLRDQLTERVENRQTQLVGQVQTFEKNTVILIDNLKDISDKFNELGKVLSSRGNAWKALLLGRHKYWESMYTEIKERISKISGSMKDDFKNSTATYVEETNTTKKDLQSEIADITQKENAGLKANTDELDGKQKQQIDAEFEGLAGDLANEIDETLQHNIKHCADTTVRLKDSTETTLHTHKDDYDLAINRHRENGLGHYDSCNSDVTAKVDAWYTTMDLEHQKSKNLASTEVANQVQDVKNFNNKSKDSNDNHSREFDREVKEIKTTQRQIFDQMEQEVLDDFNGCKSNVSEKIDNEIALIKEEVQKMDENQHTKIDEEITLFTDECAKMEDSLHVMLEDQKAKYQENATTLQTELTKTVQDNIQNVKDAIADFTLNFMNSIDEATEKAENNEKKLTEIFDASEKLLEQKHTTTWHIIGKEALVSSINDVIWRTKSTVIIVTPTVEAKVLEILSQAAYKKKNARFFYTTNWDLQTYGGIIEKMKQLGNIQFRNLKAGGEFYAVSRDAEEVVLGPNSKDQRDMIALVSSQEGYNLLFAQFIGPVFQANSRPI